MVVLGLMLVVFLLVWVWVFSKMKTFKEFLKEQLVPTNVTGSAVANWKPFLFPKDEDLLSQDYQTAAESGEDIYARFGGVYPVMKVSLGNNMGDGPSVNQMVDASNKFTEIMDARTASRIKKNFSRFMGRV